MLNVKLGLAMAALAGFAVQGALAGDAFRALVFSKTAGFRHGSIPSGIAMMQQLAADNCFEIETSESSSIFNAADLARFDVVIFLCTTGNILNETEQAAFETWFRAGGGFVGIHSATDTEYQWPFYGQLVGAYFSNHPAIQNATITIEDRDHPSTSFLADQWARRDEWYNFATNPRPLVRVLATLDESSYNGGQMGADHPIVWCREFEFEGGRSWYTAGGHTSESYSEPEFRRHVLGGVFWAAGAPLAQVPGDADFSGRVGFADITAILGGLGTVALPGQTPLLGDADASGAVSFADITTALANLGNVCQ